MAPLGLKQENLSDPELPKFKGQIYDDIKRACLAEHKLWTDPEFGPTDTSIWEGSPKIDNVEWKRVHEISKEARLFIKGHSEDDVKQGYIGDCWFVASVACFALQDPLVKRVIPSYHQQELNTDDYCGVLLFRFYRFGQWTEVVVDDYLPTRNGKLVFMFGNDPNEFWAAFLEKAYAKLDGCYESLSGGQTADALNDLTGGTSEKVNFSQIGSSMSARLKLYRQLQRALSRGALVSLGMSRTDGEEVEARRDNGLFAGHAYSLLRCFELTLEFIESKRELAKVRNPWGEAEWNGRWGDDYVIWSIIPKEDKDALNFTNEDDGEFWMEFDDLMDNFTDMTICRIINTDPTGGDDCWHQAHVKAAWIPGLTAGGCSNYLDTFFTNPQVQFKIEGQDDEVVQIVLEQKDTRIDKERDNMTIGYMIFKVSDDNTDKVDSVMDILEVPAGTNFINSRQLYNKFELSVGTYVIIPSTFDPHVEGEFLLKIFTENEAHVTELTD